MGEQEQETSRQTHVDPNTGTRVDSIVISAKEPALIEAAIKRMVDETIKEMPHDVIQHIVEQVIHGGDIFTRGQGYAKTRVSLSDLAKDVIASQLTSYVTKRVDELLQTDGVKKLIEEQIVEGITPVLANIPQVAVRLMVGRIASVFGTGSIVDPYGNVAAEFTPEGVAKTVGELKHAVNDIIASMATSSHDGYTPPPVSSNIDGSTSKL